MAKLKKQFVVNSKRSILVIARDAWALDNLITAGKKGCTPITHVGSRWSAYVFNLKRKHGLDVKTITEAHEGLYAGSHARYVLHTKVEAILDSEVA